VNRIVIWFFSGQARRGGPRWTRCVFDVWLMVIK
jgi:hypothetical protein